MSLGGRMRNEAAALRLPRGGGLLRVLLAAVLVVLMASGSAGTNAQVGAPALEVEYEVTPASDELTVEITVAGRGGREGGLLASGNPCAPVDAAAPEIEGVGEDPLTDAEKVAENHVECLEDAAPVESSGKLGLDTEGVPA